MDVRQTSQPRSRFLFFFFVSSSLVCFAVPPLFTGRPIDDPAMAPWFQVNPPELRLSWDPSLLTTGEASETVDIVLVQYQESRDQVSID